MKKFDHKIKVFHLNSIHRNSGQVAKLLRSSDHEFEIRRASTISEFKKNIFEYRPEVIIADHRIDLNDPSEAVEFLRQSGLHIPVILITDFESEEFAKTLVKAGATDYIFIERPERLQFALSQAVELRRVLSHTRIQLEHSAKEFSDLVENIPVGLTIWNKQRQLVYFNHAMHDFSFDRTDGLQEKWRKVSIDIYDQENNKFSLDKDILTACLTDGKTINRDGLHIMKADGSKRYVNVLASPSRNTDGSITGVTMMFFDVTAHQLAQMKTKALNDLLHAKNDELAQFAHIVSHHLRDPIAKVLGLASICDTTTDDSRFIVKKITEEANRLDSVAKDLNVIVSVRNVEKEKRESLAFGHEFSLVSQVLKREIQDSNAIIETDFADQKEIVTVKSYLYSVLYNLLSNSIKYRDINKPLAISMRTYRIGQYACLSVKDNGLGIDLKKNREKIFGLYKRFHSEHIPGRGVGLHFVKTYAEALGGKVEIDSELHEGTELKVYFLNQNHDREEKNCFDR